MQDKENQRQILKWNEAGLVAVLVGVNIGAAFAIFAGEYGCIAPALAIDALVGAGLGVNNIRRKKLDE